MSQLILPSMHVTSANVGFSVNVAGIPFFELSFTTALAGQLFCEAVARRATEPLHLPPLVTFEVVDIDPEYLERNASLSVSPGAPIQLRTRLVPAQAPEVATAVRFAYRMIELVYSEDGVEEGDVECALVRVGLMDTVSNRALTRLGTDLVDLTLPTPSALLASATPDSAPKPAHKLSRNPLQLHAQPIDREEEKAP